VQHAAALIAIDDAAATRAADLDREVDRLLHDAGARAAFLKRPPANGPLASLRAADLEHAARVIVRETLHRRQLGCGDLAGAYARTLAGRDVTALLERFLASQAYARHREVPLAGLGICLEEAFYRFAADDPSIDQTTLTHEFLAAMVRALAVSPEPGFTVPPELRACPGGHFALHGEGPHLYAITRGRIVSGAVTPLLADLLTGAAPPAAAPAAHAQLCALGLC